MVSAGRIAVDAPDAGTHSLGPVVTVIVRVVGNAIGLPERDGSVFDGEFLQFYDPNGFDGAGQIKTTSDRNQAMRFDRAAEVVRCYRQVSRTHPVRTDGQPNRPLTAFTISIEPEP